MSKYENSISGKLQQIYDIKGEIAEVIGTNSTDFSEYPSIIENAIQSGGSGSSVDPFYGDSLDILGAIQEDTFPVNAGLMYSEISSDFTVNKTPNEVVESVEWKQSYDDGNSNIYTIKYIVNTSHNLAGNDSGEIGIADSIAQSLNDYSDLYGNIFPTLTEATMTKSADPGRDGYDYLVEGNLYTWNLMDNADPVETITENGFVPNNSVVGYNVQVKGGGLEPGSESWIINGIEVAEFRLGGSRTFWAESSMQPWDASGVLNNSTTFDEYMHFINLIDLNFTDVGIDDPNQFVSKAGQWTAYDNNGVVVSDLYCIAMVNPNYTGYQWCHVTGTLQNDTIVKFTLDVVNWDGMSWSAVGNEADLEIMPIVTYDYQNDTKSVDYTGTYISLPAGDIDMYFQYVPGDMGDPDKVEVYVATLDEYDNPTKRYVKISDTELTFYDPNAQ